MRTRIVVGERGGSTRVLATLVLACSAVPLAACSLGAPEPEPAPAPAACAEAERAAQELTVEVATRVVGEELPACVDGVSTSMVIAEEWADLVAVDGVPLPAVVQLDPIGFPADCAELDGASLTVLIDGEWYRARSVECAQNG